MADDSSASSSADRRRVTNDQGYDLNYFAAKHRITRHEARKLLSTIGKDREKLNEAAQKLRPRIFSRQTSGREEKQRENL